ncbi:DUF6491 family protein [Hyphomonas sp.]|uniref:DUF6491 family protein n=1 Tax=Hyphomonas sp. TaxID=87 RepID=UPI00391D5385
MLRALPLIAAAAALVACSSTPGSATPSGIARYADDPRLGEEARNICFARSIDGFSMNERDSVVLHEGRTRYLVAVAGTCMDLEYAEAIALDTPTGCLTPGDAIIVSRAMGGTFGPQRCIITSIRNWDPKAKAKPAPEAAPAAEENPA